MTADTPILESALTSSLNLLETFAATTDFLPKLQLAYGEGLSLNPVEFSQLLSELPSIEVLSSAAMNGARGVYAEATNQIYLSSELLEGEFDAVVSVLLEEIGHYLDSRLNVVDAPGDEGAIFSAVVRGENLTPTEVNLSLQTLPYSSKLL